MGKSQDPDLAPRFLDSIGIFGWARIERVLMSAIVAGKPILLIGPHGTNKTNFSRAASHALIRECRFKPYNTPVLKDEELVGILNPLRLKKGELEYIKTPTTIWGVDAVSLEEITRASPFIVNKCYEIVQSKTVNGKPTNVKYVFATANPPQSSRAGYSTSYLDLAMASRFACVVTPEAKDFSAADMSSVIDMALDGRVERFDKELLRSDWGEPFRDAIARAKASYAKWSNKKHNQKINQVTRDLCKKLNYEWQLRDMQGFARMVKAAVCLEQATEVPTTLEDWQLILAANFPQLTGIVKERSPVEISQLSDILAKLEFKTEYEEVKLPDLFDDKKLLQDPLTLLNVIRDIASSVTDPVEIFHTAARLWKVSQDKSVGIDLTTAEAEVLGLVSYGMTLEGWADHLPSEVQEVAIDSDVSVGSVLKLVVSCVLDTDTWEG